MDGRRTFVDVGLLLLRITAGGMLAVGHGWDKLIHFSEKAAEFSDPLGMGSQASLAAATASELLCGLLIVVGLATRLACLPVIFSMGVAALVVHAGDPIFLPAWPAREPALLYMLMALALLFTGPGRISVDRLLVRKQHERKERKAQEQHERTEPAA